MIVASEIQETVKTFACLMKGCKEVVIPSVFFSFVQQRYCLYVRGNQNHMYRGLRNLPPKFVVDSFQLDASMRLIRDLWC